MFMLSLAGLGGMIVLMSIIVWQMQGNVIKERHSLIRAQVESAHSLVRQTYGEYRRGLIGEEDAKQVAMDHIEAMRYLNNGYFWIIDRDGVMLMHPFSKEIVGQLTLDQRDPEGRYFVRDFLAAARGGGGFVEYGWPRPGGSEPVIKIGYVLPFEAWGWVIGSGLYVDDLRSEAVRQIWLGAALVFVLFGINILLSLWLSTRYINVFRRSAIRDALTGLYSRGYLEEIGPKLVSRFGREGEQHLAAIFFDIDHFKVVNDHFGHKVGDVVLREVGRIVKGHLRPNEPAFRYGGEELVVLLHASEADCIGIGERIRKAIDRHTFSASESEFSITISVGIAMAVHGESLSEILKRADRCLYVAKARGRNCTVSQSDVATFENAESHH